VLAGFHELPLGIFLRNSDAVDPGCWKQSLRRVIIPQIPVKGKWISPVPPTGKRLDARPLGGYSAHQGHEFPGT